MGLSVASTSPSQRRQIHSSTRLFSPNPGQTKLPSASLRNQLTRKTRGSFSGSCWRPTPEPVAEVVGHVVAAERQHRHRVEAQLADVPGCRGGRLHRHGRAEEHAVLPVERLRHEGDDGRPAPAEQEGVDRNAPGVLPLGRDGGALRRRRREPGVGMRGRLIRIGRPVVAQPVDRVLRRLVGHPLPPHVAIVGERAVREDRIALDGLHGVRVRLLRSCRGRRRRTRPRG